jgi:multidrug efflux system membrane fusion protein
MTARVILNPSAENVKKYMPKDEIKVPVVAVASDERGNPFVWRIDPSTMKVSRVAVMLGEIGTTDIVVTSGLDRGDRIAITGVSQLFDGTQVRPLE